LRALDVGLGNIDAVRFKSRLVESGNYLAHTASNVERAGARLVWFQRVRIFIVEPRVPRFQVLRVCFVFFVI
jgi:hypothetical protein